LWEQLDLVLLAAYVRWVVAYYCPSYDARAANGTADEPALPDFSDEDTALLASLKSSIDLPEGTAQKRALAGILNQVGLTPLVFAHMCQQNAPMAERLLEQLGEGDMYIAQLVGGILGTGEIPIRRITRGDGTGGWAAGCYNTQCLIRISHWAFHAFEYPVLIKAIAEARNAVDRQRWSTHSRTVVGAGPISSVPLPCAATEDILPAKVLSGELAAPTPIATAPVTGDQPFTFESLAHGICAAPHAVSERARNRDAGERMPGIITAQVQFGSASAPEIAGEGQRIHDFVASETDPIAQKLRANGHLNTKPRLTAAGDDLDSDGGGATLAQATLNLISPNSRSGNCGAWSWRQRDLLHALESRAPQLCKAWKLAVQQGGISLVLLLYHNNQGGRWHWDWWVWICSLWTRWAQVVFRAAISLSTARDFQLHARFSAGGHGTADYAISRLDGGAVIMLPEFYCELQPPDDGVVPTAFKHLLNTQPAFYHKGSPGGEPGQVLVATARCKAEDTNQDRSYLVRESLERLETCTVKFCVE